MSESRKRANIMLIGQRPGEEGRALKYKPEFGWVVRDLAQEGKFPEEWCAEIGITMSTLYAWSNTYPEFEEAVLIGWHVLNAYWTRRAREIVENPVLYADLKATVFLEILRKRFPESWGRNARNTQETFETRAKPIEGEAQRSPLADPEKIRAADMDEIERRIAALEARRKAEGEGK